MTTGKNIFAGTESDGVYLSTDRGKNWTTVNSGMTDSCILSLAVSNSSIFAGTRNSIYRSTDNGAKWTKVYFHSGMTFKSLTVCGSVIIAGASPITSTASIGVILSSDGGVNWTSAEPGLKYKKVEALTTIGTTVFAGTWGEGVHLSSDNGKTWNAAGAGLTCGEISAIAAGGGSVFAGTDGGVFRSDNTAALWTLTSSGIVKVCINALSTSGDTVYAGTDRDGVFISTDNGGKWTQIVSGLMRDRVYSLAVNESNVFAGTDSMGIFRLSGIGSSWTAVGSGTLKSEPIIDITALGNTVFAESNSGIFRSTDNGEHWGMMNTGLPGGGSAFVVKDNTLFIGADSGVFRSTDNGASWTAANSGLSNYRILSLAVLGNTLFAGTYLHGIYQSIDNGGSWERSNEWSFSIEELFAVDSALFGFSSTSVFYTADNGTTWNTIHDGIIATQFKSFAVSRTMVFVGTRYDGIWRRPVDNILNAINDTRSPRAVLPPACVGAYTIVKNNSHLTVAFTLPRQEKVTIEISALSGTRKIFLVNQFLGPGPYCFRWDTRKAATGIYTVRMRAGSETHLKNMPVLR
ncbi:MAG: hypothetical protein JXA18_00355 [Chitinispirillaceae bacterium]|nr:hypothetical protein [Chitinispirillaceae bacterium]